ncbi:hypothetical protein [Mycobacterium sp.]|uniref:hypothetical protein n=1 Tax=Mycobacterium sp. TaxID=1785 RepID=UPI0031DA463D
MGNRGIAGRTRRRVVGFATVAGSGVAAALIGMTIAPAVHADDTDTAGVVVSQAAANISQAAQVLSEVPTGSLDTEQASSLFIQLSLDYGEESAVLGDESQQADLSSAVQNSSMLVIPDKELLATSYAVLAADQTAGADPSSAFGDSLNLGLLQADYEVVRALLDVGVAEIVARFADIFQL